ncbi:hypothetical protein ABE438_17310 [Bosea sp. TWI1241]|uniref:hypothetical protein n=1 Tax=Bosea sp. TWI1241 TaxID=3148904 RepID=UPI003208BEFD
MAAQPIEQPEDDTCMDAEITGLVGDLLDEYGSEAAALRALAQSFIVLLADADRSVSRGFVRGVFSQGARPERDG